MSLHPHDQLGVGVGTQGELSRRDQIVTLRHSAWEAIARCSRCSHTPASMAQSIPPLLLRRSRVNDVHMHDALALNLRIVAQGFFVLQQHALEDEQHSRRRDGLQLR